MIRSSKSDRDIHNYPDKSQHPTHHRESSNQSCSPNYSVGEPDLRHSFSHYSKNNFVSASYLTQSLPNNESHSHPEAIVPSDSGFAEFSAERSSSLNPTDFVYLPPSNTPLSPDASSNDDPSAAAGLPLLSSVLSTSREVSAPSSPPSSPSFSGSTNLDGCDIASETEEHVSFRFEHREDGDGNHVIVGREGVLKKCEDEPICTPGSVQAFGVLIAVQEVEDTLVVRQASENSTELLGLPPRYLFSLSCFTDTLPGSQANLLWENIPDAGDSKDDDDGGPQVFLLSGWGAPGTEFSGDRRSWTCWCVIHRPTLTNDSSSPTNDMLIMEFELERDLFNPLYPPLRAEGSPLFSGQSRILAAGSAADFGPDRQISIEDTLLPDPSENGLKGDDTWLPTPDDVRESTTVYSKSISALERLRKMTFVPASSAGRTRRSQHRHGVMGSNHLNFGMMDMFAVLSQINEQLGAVDSLELFLKVVVGVIKDLTQFHRVMVYQFDESWNGQVVAELVDWTQTRDLYKGLHFPASDIPAQARALYTINKVRILYNRSQNTARLVVKSKEDLEVPLNMSHCYLRAMSPIHIKYLANMGVRASMSISILAFGSLWGLITCHSYGPHGMRVSFPVRQMLRLLSQSISRNIE
ncbi:Cyanobacterial phytochrome B, partial [Termitomyces sp. T112]